jgi:hypothetical protein
MLIMNWHTFLAVFGLVLMALAAPPALAKKSWLWFFAALILSLLVVVLPLFAFFFSAILVPDSKAGCNHGWLDCFMVGKLALMPLALVATAALYSLEVWRVKNRTMKWVVVGIFLGALVSVPCLVYGVCCIGLTKLMLVPLYVAAWYTIRSVQLIKASDMRLKSYLGMLLGSLPFWVGSVLWSQNTYASLPDTSNCFVVTAAGRGHRRLVGPIFKVNHAGRRVRANQQLIRLWQFENLWRIRAPRSHASFRHFYNRLGPVIAAQIRSPWQADLAYLTIKPLELAVKLVMPSGKKTRT